MASLALRKTQLYHESQKAVELRDLFISLAAHELRTPLTTLNGYIQLLHAKVGKEKSTISNWVRELFFESKRLTYLVSELLEANKIKAGVFNYQWEAQSMNDIVQRAINNFKISHPERKIQYENKTSNGNSKIIADVNKMLQVLGNLLENANKFSQPEKQIYVTLKYSSPYVILSVKDEGRGIDKKDMPHIFDEFYKGSHNIESGMGLGLFLVKNIVQQHQGNLAVTSEKDKGTTIEFRLPKATI